MQVSFLNSSLTVAFNQGSLPAPGNDDALQRLEQNSELSTPSSAGLIQSPTQFIWQRSLQLLTLLTSLMLGQPTAVSAQPSTATQEMSQAGIPGAKIPGGSSLYSKGKGMFHKGAPGAPDTYAFENSPAGIKFAAERGYASIDIDMQITKDGVPVATHWSKPMAKDGFYDPEGKIKPNTKVKDMTLAEVMRLRNKDGQSQIYPLSTMIEELKKNKIAGDFEAKDDSRFATPQMMGQIASMVRSAGIQANLKSINRGPRSMDILKTAQQQGFWVRFAEGNGKSRQSIGYGN